MGHIKKLLFLMAMVLTTSVAHVYAYDFMVDGLCYNKNSDGTSVTVTYERDYYYNDSYRSTYSSLSDSLSIPASVSYGGNDYSVTSIGWSAFKGCSGLTSVTIPNSVTSIGHSAFYGCSGLTSVTIPNSVTSIGNSAFYGCHNLTSVTIGSSVTSIGQHVFYGCSGLTSVTIPESVTSIGGYAFADCSGLTSVTIPNSVTSIGQYAFSGCSGLTSVTIGNSVSSICECAFYECDCLTSVTIGNSVKTIGDYAFYGCSGLTSVTIPNSVISIGYSAFSGCSGLTSVTIGNSVSSICEGAFYECDCLTSVTIGNSVTEIGACAFYGCSGLTSVTIPNSVISIGYSAFEGCSGLTSVTIGNSVTKIGNCAFYGCSGLTSVYITDLVKWCGIDFEDNPLGYAQHLYLNGQEVKDLTIPNSVTSIANSAFRNCTGLTSVTIPNSVTSIGQYAFSGCSGLTSVTIGNSVTEIGSYAFMNCDGLTSVTWNARNCADPSEEYSLFDCNTSIQLFTIGNEVKRLPAYICYGLSGLTSVTIGNSVTSIGEYAFKYCSGLTSVTIPNSVTEIGNSAFSGCSGLTSVTIPNSVTEIGEHAFESCGGLSSVTIGNSVTSIGNSAFSYCGLTSVTIPESVTEIGERAFVHCDNLTSVTIPNSVTSIGGSAFQDCFDLQIIVSHIINPCEVSLGTSVFDYINKSSCVLFVPSTSLTIYKTAPQWKEFKNIQSFVAQSITLDKEQLNLVVGQDETLTVTIIPEGADTSVNWQSSDQTVVTVDDNGKVKAMKFGTATITATTTDGSNLSATCSVNVTGATGIKLDKTSASIYYMQSFKLSATISPVDVIVNGVTWMSSDTNVVTVDDNGNVTGVGLGSASITATTIDGTNLSATCKVTVTGATAITLDKTANNIYYNETFTLTPTFTPNDLIVKAVTWKSSNTSVATVDTNGKVKGVGLGTATITATTTDGTSLSAACKVTVTGATGITLDKNEANIYYNQSFKLIPTVTPSDLLVKTLTWKSSNANVATVDNIGRVKGVGLGSSIITATTTDGTNLSATCRVTVTGATGIMLDKSEVQLFAGESQQLTATLQPSDLADKTVSWISSNTGVAKVGGGKVTAVAKGTATITAKTTDGTNLSAACKVIVLADYQFSADSLKHLRGEPEAVVELPVALDNKTAVAQLQFDVTLPESVTIVGEYDASTDRTHYDECIRLDDARKSRSHHGDITSLGGNKYRVLISTSQTNTTLKGNHGTVAYLKLHIAQYHEAGDYAIAFSNIVLSGTDQTDRHTAANANSVVRLEYMLGDANADVDVDVADYQAAARTILELSTPRFYFDAANVGSSNNVIDVQDLQGIVNIMGGINPATIKHAPRAMAATTELAIVPRVTGDGNVAIALTGDIPIGALQMDLTLPQGVTLECATLTSRGGKHQVDYATLADGTVRILVGSPTRATLEPGDEAFLVLTLAGARGGTATLGDALAVEPDMTTYSLADAAFDLTPTGVDVPTVERARIYVDGNLLVIDSPMDGTAQLVRVNGITLPLDVSAGRNEYTLDQGVYIVRMGATVAKIMIKP